MSRPLPRFTNTTIQDEQQLAAILLQTGDPAPTQTTYGATLPGDNRRLRGIPTVARGVAGVSPGTDPYHETERRMMPRTPR
jgi:hypothetical protein